MPSERLRRERAMRTCGRPCWWAMLIAAVLSGCGGGHGNGGGGGAPAQGGIPANEGAGEGPANGGGGGMPPVAATSTLAGAVIGGVAPISGSIVALYRAGATLGGSAQSLGTSTSDPQGRFSIPFTNPGTSAILYLVASGGDAGHGPNPAIQLALMLGRADTLPSAPVTVNEVTSVVFVYAMNFFIQASSDHSISE